MSAVSRRIRGTAIARRFTDMPLVRNAYSLVGSTLATSAFGMIFWIIAARAFRTDVVGINSALISTMLLLAGISTLNLANGFNRFVPTAGEHGRRLVVVGYGATLAVSVAVSVVFIAGTSVWADQLSFLREDAGQAVWFVTAVALWTIFMLQDGVLAGLGEGPWVLAENLLYGIAKLFLLFAAAIAAARYGIFVAWTAPLFFLVVAVNWLVFRRFIPHRDQAPVEEFDLHDISRSVGVDYLATLMMTGMQGILPLLVLAVSGPTATAYVVLAWTVAYPLHLLSLNVGMAMTTEAARSPERLLEFTRHAVGHALRIVGGLALLLTIAAPFVLRVFGGDYAANATRPLQLFALAAIPFVFLATYMSAARVRRRMWLVVGLTGAYAALTLTLAAVLLHVMGITGVGLAWLIGTGVVAGFLLLGDLRTLWLHRIRPARVQPVVRPARRFAMRRTTREAKEAARDILGGAGFGGNDWVAEPDVAISGGICSVGLHDARTDTHALLRVAIDRGQSPQLRREVAALETIGQIAPAPLRRLVPRIITSRCCEEPAWLLEQREPGAVATLPVTHTSWRELTDAVVSSMSSLYRCTATLTVLDDDILGQLLPIRAEDGSRRGLLRTRPDSGSAASALARELEGRTAITAMTHGNLWPGSLLRQQDGTRLTGIVDWHRLHRAPPVVDIAHLLCTGRAFTERREFGEVVRDVISTNAWPDDDARTLARVPGASEFLPREAALLAWFMHVSARTEQPHRFGAEEVWLVHNVQLVLDSL